MPRVDNLYIWTKIVVMFFASKPTIILYHSKSH